MIKVRSKTNEKQKKKEKEASEEEKKGWYHTFIGQYMNRTSAKTFSTSSYLVLETKEKSKCNLYLLHVQKKKEKHNFVEVFLCFFTKKTSSPFAFPFLFSPFYFKL